MTDEKIPVWNHTSVRVQDREGSYHTIQACRLTPDDINDDGTVSMPPSGECDCFEGMDLHLIGDFNRDIAEQENLKSTAAFIRSAGYVPKRELHDLAESWQERATEINRTRQAHRIYANGKADAIRECAEQLEELINE